MCWEITKVVKQLDVLSKAYIKESQNFLLKGLKFSRGIDFINFV